MYVVRAERKTHPVGSARTEDLKNPNRYLLAAVPFNVLRAQMGEAKNYSHTHTLGICKCGYNKKRSYDNMERRREYL